MISRVVEELNAERIKEVKPPVFAVGDSVKVHVRIREGEKDRVQVFAGTVIARDGRGATEMFTVRRVSQGVGVERTFPVYSPYLTKVVVEGHGHARRAKLYFLRNASGKKAKLRPSRKKARFETNAG